jgi:hypothetical protein
MREVRHSSHREIQVPALFQYDTCGDASCKGKLDAAARCDYAPDLGTIAVTETYQYNLRR